MENCTVLMLVIPERYCIATRRGNGRPNHFLTIKSHPGKMKSNAFSRLEVLFIVNSGRIEAQKD